MCIHRAFLHRTSSFNINDSKYRYMTNINYALSLQTSLPQHTSKGGYFTLRKQHYPYKAGDTLDSARFAQSVGTLNRTKMKPDLTRTTWVVTLYNKLKQTSAHAAFLHVYIYWTRTYPTIPPPKTGVAHYSQQGEYNLDICSCSRLEVLDKLELFQQEYFCGRQDSPHVQPGTEIPDINAPAQLRLNVQSRTFLPFLCGRKSQRWLGFTLEKLTDSAHLCAGM